MTPLTAERLRAALAERYGVERELGQGGMATVWLAEDLKHARKVAIKVLHPELSAVIGAERFLAEIRLTAQLQHPHILGLIDSGEADGLLYYVMPYVDGESLRARLAREKQLPVEDALRLAKEVASALEYAHKRGVVHRDIKPENILLQDDAALVADFGIALAVSQAGGNRMTQTGLSLGTPAYMSPEQAMGERDITPRADIYALGAMTYEMLASEPPFTGSSSQAIVARVLTEAPRSIISQRHTVPPHVEAAVLKALEKLPADRFTSATQFADALARPGFATVPMTGARTVALPAARVRSRGVLPWALLGVAVLAAAAGWLRRPSRVATSWHYMTLGNVPPIDLGTPGFTLSPDGNMFVFTTNAAPFQLWLKRRGELDARPIPGTEFSAFPSFSPDGQWLVFVARDKLVKVRADGGPVTTLADTASNSFGGAAWLDDGTLVYVGPTISALSRMNAHGGARTPLPLDSSLAGLGIGSPRALPGARGFLFITCTSGCVSVALHVYDLERNVSRKLLDDVAAGWFLPDGRLLYVRRDGAALAAPFDLKKLEFTGAPVTVLEGVLTGAGVSQLAWAPSGDVVYMRGSGVANAYTPVRVDRNGLTTPFDSTWRGPFNSFAISPSGRQLAVGVGLSTNSLSIWTKQLDTGPFTRSTFSGLDRRPAWSFDGKRIAFVRDSQGTSQAWMRGIDGTSERPLPHLDRQIQEVTWSPDGKWVLVRTDNGAPGLGDIVGLPTSGDGKPVPFVASPATELHPAVSPDGRWLAYTSNESGINEVYVRPFPNVNDGRWQISTGGGEQPRWSPDGRELTYVSFLDASFYAATLRTGTGLEVVERHRLFRTSPWQLDAFHTSYDVLPDGRGYVFLQVYGGGTTTAAPLVRGEHWFTELEARLK